MRQMNADLGGEYYLTSFS